MPNEIEDYPNYSDFADTRPQLEGEKKGIAEIFNIRILVTGFRVGKSKYKDRGYLTLQFKFRKDGEKYIIFTASEPLIDESRKSEVKMPYYTTIVQRGKYYTMT
jgi:hypothetical protein